MKKKIFTLLAASVLGGWLSAATIGVGAFDDSTYDGFQGAKITYSTPSANAEDLPISNIFNGGSSGGDATDAAVFKSLSEGEVAFVEFETASPVRIRELKLALREDNDNGFYGGQRSASRWVLYGNERGSRFTSRDIISSGDIDPDYIDTYGFNAIVVTEKGLSVTAQYFRLELTQADSLGVRVMELGARVTGSRR